MLLLTDSPFPCCDRDLELDGITLHVDICYDGGGPGLAPMTYPVLRGATVTDPAKFAEAYGDEALREAVADAEGWAEGEFLGDMDKAGELLELVD